MMNATTRSRRCSSLWYAALALALLGILLFPQQSVAQSPPTHTVQPGESLSQIAQRYGVPMAAIMELNEIDDPDTIVIGQVLRLPLAEPEATATPIAQSPLPDVPAPAEPLPDDEPASDAPPVEVDPQFIFDAPPDTHTVQPGETLSQIARGYGLSVGELMELNGIEDADTIVIGQKLRLTPPLETNVAREPEPTPDSSSEAQTPITPTNRNPIASLNPTYTVRAGDSISSIALRFGVNEDALRRINRIDAQSAPLAIGQELILPATRAELVVEPPPDETSSVQTYTVQRGDSLSVIAQTYGLSFAELLSANGIANPDAIYVGQTLIIPPPTIESEPEEEVLPSQQIGRPASGFFFYTVKPGDTLSELAREFDSTVLALLEYNNLPNPETVYRGLDLRIPYGPPPLPERMPPVPMSGTRFLVSLSRQQCWLFQGDRVVHSWICSTGYGQWITRTGTFYVQTKLEMAKSSAYELDMPYWLGIYDVGTFENGIHGLPIRWETGEKIWTGLVGQPATFGCAMLNDEDAATLFEKAFLGMPVHIVQ